MDSKLTFSMVLLLAAGALVGVSLTINGPSVASADGLEGARLTLPDAVPDFARAHQNSDIPPRYILESHMIEGIPPGAAIRRLAAESARSYFLAEAADDMLCLIVADDDAGETEGGFAARSCVSRDRFDSDGIGLSFVSMGVAEVVAVVPDRHGRVVLDRGVDGGGVDSSVSVDNNVFHARVHENPVSDWVLTLADGKRPDVRVVLPTRDLLKDMR